MRFIKYQDIQTDEMMNITMSGNIIFHSHWLINSAEKITDRSNSLGATFINPIKTTPAPYVIWRQVYCPPSDTQCNPQFFPGGSGTSYGPSNCPFNATTRYCASGLYSYGDQRGYPAGFYQYHNDRSSGTTPFTIVSDGMVLVKTNDGGLIALENGSPTASTNNQPQLATISQPASILGAESPQRISYIQATQHLGKNVTVSGTIASVVNNRPKAMYLGFTDPHDGNLLLRVFEQDLAKFNYDLSSLLGKRIEVTGFITLYWPDNIDPEIRITDPSQIKIIN